jgi:dTDP-4-dehydrorhamnose reductase
MKRVLVTGAGGFLGSNLVVIFRERFDVTATYFRNPIPAGHCHSLPMDITRSGEVLAVVERLRPEVVVHCAAEARVDYCEAHPEDTFRINVEGARNVAEAARLQGAKFVYISTDSVFDGRKGPYGEEAAPSPRNVYAQSKLHGEQAVQERVGDYLIIRTNFFGWSLKPRLSLAEWILDRLARGQTVPGFVDIYFSPILVNDLAGTLRDMIVMDLRGLYHVGSSQRWSKFEFARNLCRVFGKDMELVRPTRSDDAGLAAPRAKDTSLDVRKVIEAVGRPMPDTLDGLVRFRELIDNGYLDRLRSGIPRTEACHA